MTLGWHLAKEIKGNESDFVNKIRRSEGIWRNLYIYSVILHTEWELLAKYQTYKLYLPHVSSISQRQISIAVFQHLHSSLTDQFQFSPLLLTNFLSCNRCREFGVTKDYRLPKSSQKVCHGVKWYKISSNKRYLNRINGILALVLLVSNWVLHVDPCGTQN